MFQLEIENKIKEKGDAFDMSLWERFTVFAYIFTIYSYFIVGPILNVVQGDGLERTNVQRMIAGSSTTLSFQTVFKKKNSPSNSMCTSASLLVTSMLNQSCMGQYTDLFVHQMQTGVAYSHTWTLMLPSDDLFWFILLPFFHLAVFDS